jgi:hypothetical protein
MSKPTSATAVRDRLSGALTVGTGRQTEPTEPAHPQEGGTVTQLPTNDTPAPAPRSIERPADRTVTRPSRPERLVRVTVDLDPDVHQAVKVRLAEGSVTLASVVRELLRRYDQDPDTRHDVLTVLYAEQN